ncbi:hypothetical protein QUD64_10125 [Lactococcus cremoris]|uniref:hypothetical protein n=1 Tax=Lactococcus lactis subsp. cremoris TaxID=1359 RepID=UPI0025A23F45|nr:hypothetical protein [Lactococcus cremoris]MDM7654508.1 hypothetical protein [Lactococcus cremoris]
MKIKYILWIICALLLLNTGTIFAQEIGGTSTIGEVGFLEKGPIEKGPIEKPPETSSAPITTNNSKSINQKLPIVGSTQGDTLTLMVLLLIIGAGALTIKHIGIIRIKENYNEKNNN